MHISKVKVGDYFVSVIDMTKYGNDDVVLLANKKYKIVEVNIISEEFILISVLSEMGIRDYRIKCSTYFKPINFYFTNLQEERIDKIKSILE